MTNARQIASEFVIQDAKLGIETLPVSEDFYVKLTQRFGDFAGSTLVSCHSFESDWATWEMHPKGDELVILLAGAATMVLAAAAGDESITLSAAGEYIVVPRGVWHTAQVAESAQMLFMTPGEGTENRDQPIR